MTMQVDLSFTIQEDQPVRVRLLHRRRHARLLRLDPFFLPLLCLELSLPLRLSSHLSLTLPPSLAGLPISPHQPRPFVSPVFMVFLAMRLGVTLLTSCDFGEVVLTLFVLSSCPPGPLLIQQQLPRLALLGVGTKQPRHIRVASALAPDPGGAVLPVLPNLGEARALLVLDLATLCVRVLTRATMHVPRLRLVRQRGELAVSEDACGDGLNERVNLGMNRVARPQPLIVDVVSVKVNGEQREILLQCHGDLTRAPRRNSVAREAQDLERVVHHERLRERMDPELGALRHHARPTHQQPF
mmetsp:Transcript_33239/g.76862  ORF Transcript_33239/g.76862 Transcript_33239/m.76862 type:complete len:299 (-) Transcript_33239:1369-2265(-)